MYTYYFLPTRNVFGEGSVNEAGNVAKSLGISKILIVTDAFLATTGMPERLQKIFSDAGVKSHIFPGADPNPTDKNVETGLKVFKDAKCDGLVSLGGGSSHDCAKAIALLATNGGKIQDYVGLNKSKAPSTPLIAVNTTAGTGSELTRFCVITDEERHLKMTITDWHVTPIIAVNDAELMLDMPPGLTAATGLDALTHAIEAYVSTQSTPVTDCKALKAIELIGVHLQPAVDNGQSLDAREGMIYAEYLAGIAFNNASLGYVHALAHQLGGLYNLPHGLSNALMLPAVMRFNLDSAPEKYRDIAQALGVNTLGLTVKEAAEKGVELVAQMTKGLKIPQSLREVRGFKEEDIPRLAENALKDICGLTNPRQATQEELEAIFRSVL